VFQIWRAFATAEQTAAMRREFENGIGWGEAKKRLFELLNAELKEPRQRYDELMQNSTHIEKVLKEGAEKARAVSAPLLKKLRKAVGIYGL